MKNKGKGRNKLRRWKEINGSEYNSEPTI